MNGMEGTRITCKPCVLELASIMDTSFVLEMDNLDKVCQQVNDGESPKFDLLSCHHECPGSKEVNGYVSSWKKRSFLRSCIAVASANCFEALAGIAL